MQNAGSFDRRWTCLEGLAERLHRRTGSGTRHGPANTWGSSARFRSSAASAGAVSSTIRTSSPSFARHTVLPLLLRTGSALPEIAASKRLAHLAQNLMAFFSLVMVGRLGLCAVIMSQSRGGQLVIATVFARTFMTRFGKKGIILAAVVALPVLMLGGRADADADASSTERTELLYQG